MIRMDDAASISVGDRSKVDLIPKKAKFWRQMIPCAGREYLFSTHWACLDGSPDSLREILGDVGNWQVIVVVLMMMFNIPSVFHVASPEVTTTYNDFWCHKVAKNLTVEQWKTLSSVKRVNFRGQEVVDPCFIRDLPYESAPYEDLIYMASAGDLRCRSWEYNASRLTVVSQFHLACTRLPVNNAAESVFSLGAGLGGLITAFLADRFGRRKVLMLSQGIVVVLGFMIANVSTYSTYLFVRTIMGAACSAVLLSSLILCVEITGGRWLEILSTVYTFSYSLAYMILYLTNKLFDSWIYLQYSITLITIFLLSIWWLVPESPRWLLTVQNIPRLMTVLEMASSFNRRALPAGTSTMMKNVGS